MGRAVDDRRIDHLAPAGPAGLAQRGEQADHQIERAAAEIAEQIGGHLRRAAGPADGVQRPGHRQVGDVVPGAGGQRAVLAPAGHPAVDQARWPELRERIAAAFATRTQQEWARVFAGTEACVAPVLSLGEAAGHPHLASRGTFERVGGVVQPAAAPRFSATPPGPARPPALPGAHTREVLADWGLGEAGDWLDGGAVPGPHD